MEKKSIDKIRRGEAGIERFFGQTVIYLPASLVERIGEQRVIESSLEFFPRTADDDYLPRITGPYELEGTQYYIFETDSVFEARGREHPKYFVPDKFVRCIFALP